MARKLGPKHRLCRRLSKCIWDSPRCPSVKRGFAPGQHGDNQRKKLSVYGRQLQEKQKIRTHYGLLEKQMRKTFKEAQRMGGVTGSNLLMLLESRLDCVIYRMGWANSIAGARQLVNHGHVLVNGKKVTIPSCRVMPQAAVAIAEKSRKIPMIANGAQASHHPIPEFLDRAPDSFEGRMSATPNPETIPFRADMLAIIGFYSR
jgi:small subunit ribosomal protein S4